MRFEPPYTDGHGVLVLSADQIEARAEETLRAFAPCVLDAPRSTPIREMIEAEASAGRLSYDESSELDANGAGQLVGEFLFSPPTIRIHAGLVATVRYRFAAAHEIGHYVLHRDLRVQRKDYIRTSEADVFGEPPPARRWMEWQARRFASALVIPRRTIGRALEDAMRDVRAARIRPQFRFDRLVNLIAINFDVSKTVARIRLDELGVRPPPRLR